MKQNAAGAAAGADAGLQVSNRLLRWAGLTALLGMVACGRPLLLHPKPVSEQITSSIPFSHFHVIAPIAGGSARTDLQVSLTVREQLHDSGFAVVRRAGRWDGETAALHAICSPTETPAVDGVLFVWFNRLELRDCHSGAIAYEVQAGDAGVAGVTELTNRLMHYLRGGAAEGQAS